MDLFDKVEILYGNGQKDESWSLEHHRLVQSMYKKVTKEPENAKMAIGLLEKWNKAEKKKKQ